MFCSNISTVWVVICLLRPQDCAKDHNEGNGRVFPCVDPIMILKGVNKGILGAISALIGFAPVWLLSCVLMLLAWRNDLPQ